MRFGILNEMQPGPKPWAASREYDIYHQVLEQLVLADSLGYDYAWLVEHHFLTGFSCSSSPEVFLSWLAANTKRIRLGHGVVQVNPPTNHVLRIAERAAALDIISDGRVDVGMGRGLTIDELHGFRMDPNATRSAQAEVIEMLPRIWMQERFSWEGQHYSVPELSVHPTPLQRPHPPMWFAATQPASFQIAAAAGIGLLAFGFGTPEALAGPFGDYRTTVATATPYSGILNNQIAATVPMFCAETDEEALETFGPHLETYFGYVAEYIIGRWSNTEVESYSFYRNLATTKMLDLPELSPDETAGLSPSAAAAKAGVKGGLFCVGSPETCIDFVKRWEQINVDQLILLSQVGKIDQEDLLASFRRFGTEVMPKVSSDEAP
jgi:alkanesulfonate monooxygenase SsuD/methylene tetrahydromethanopterin reductase-like flavin-dependent oxidoreductase (luciferase family)